MRFLKTLLLLIFVVFFQTTLLNLLKIKGTKPDLILITAAFFALSQGPQWGIGVGFLAGFLQDLYSPTILGLNSLAKSTAGFLLGYTKKNIYKEESGTQFLLIFLASLLQGIIYLLYSFRSIGGAAFYSFLRLTLPESFYTAILGPPSFFLLQRIFIQKLRW